MDQKWLMLVVDGSKSMEPYWPQIFSNYVQKIVRHYYRKWEEEANAKHIKVEFGLVMYNVKHGDTEWPVQGSYWTANPEDFLQSLSGLSFNGTDRTINPFTVHALAEALLMFPKPPIGKGSLEEYCEGERHCIVVPATQPSNVSVAVDLPKILGSQLLGSHTVSSMSCCYDVCLLFVQLGVSLSVLSPQLCSGWRAIFRQANKIASDEDEGDGVAIWPLRVSISPKFKDATEAVPDLDLLSPFFLDEATNFLISSLLNDDDDEPANNIHPNAPIENIPAQVPHQLPALLSLEGCSWSTLLTLNPAAPDAAPAPPAEHNTTNNHHDVINIDNDDNDSGDNNNDDGGGAPPPSSLSSQSRKRAAVSDGGGPEGGRGKRKQLKTKKTPTSEDIDSIIDNDPFLKAQIRSFPLQHNPFHVACWEGGIAMGNRESFKVIASAKAYYRKRKASATISEGWPIWLHISDFITHNVASAMRSSENRVDEVDIEMLKTNKDQLFKFLNTRNLCAKIELPSQTLILTATSEPSRFAGTLLHRGS